jgi:hypothetical protein
VNIKDLPRSAICSDVYSVSCSFYILHEGRRYIPSNPDNPDKMCFVTVKKISQEIEDKLGIRVVVDPTYGDPEWNLVVECNDGEAAGGAYNRALDAFLDAWNANVKTVAVVPPDF